MMMVRAGRNQAITIFQEKSECLGTCSTKQITPFILSVKLNFGLTEVQGHADKDNEAEPGIEVSDEVDDRDDNVSNGWEDAEHYVAEERKRESWVNLYFKFKKEKTISGKIWERRQCDDESESCIE